MEIRSGAQYPAGALSNFTPYKFEVDGVKCNSMEGFLQGLKFKNADMQAHVCTLVGKMAKSKGSKKNWKQAQKLFWKGKMIHRDSQEYQDLLDKAFLCLSKNEKFKKTILATNNSTFTHAIGKKHKNQTVLTQQEFCSRLLWIRGILQEERNEKSKDRIF